MLCDCRITTTAAKDEAGAAAEVAFKSPWLPYSENSCSKDVEDGGENKSTSLTLNS